jgi:23S rRNA pseudouridine2605 synthase
MSDLQDPRGRKLARELINIDAKLFPVGRLDYHSEGLMIFTNDGDFANTIMHPRFGIEKEYLVKVKGSFGKDEIKKMKEGIPIDGEIYKIEGIHFEI